MRNAELLALLGPALAAPFRDLGVTKVLAAEARGPILGALVATELDAGLVVARKDGQNHPGSDQQVIAAPNWRGESQLFQGRSFDLTTSDVVLGVDDWVTTGSSLGVVRSLTERAGATYQGAAVLLNKASQETIQEFAVHWLVAFDQIVA